MSLFFKKIKQIIFTITYHKSFQNFLIIGMISFIQLGNNVILGRQLTKEEFGIYSFIFLNVIRLMSYIFIFGQGASIIRYFSSKHIEDYQWKKYFLTFITCIILPIIGTSFIIKIVYNLEFIFFYIIVIGSFTLCIIVMTASLFRSRGSFNIAVFIEQAHPVPFILMLLISLFYYNKITLDFSSILKLCSFFITFPFLIYIFFKWKQGKQKVGKRIFTDGLALWELSLSVIVFLSIDAIFIPKILSYEALGLYSVIATIMQIYNFITTSLFNIYSKKFSETKNNNASGLFKLIILLIIIITIFYLIFANLILQILFDGKYIASFLLILLFCIYHSITLLYLLPSCYFIGQSSRSDLRKMIVVNISSILIKIISIFLFKNFGLCGFLIAGIISMGFRTAGGYYIAFYKKK